MSTQGDDVHERVEMLGEEELPAGENGAPREPARAREFRSRAGPLRGRSGRRGR